MAGNEHFRVFWLGLWSGGIMLGMTNFKESPEGEQGKERIPLREEIMSLIGKRCENPVVFNEPSDEQGIYLLEARSPDGETEYVYRRKGTFPGNREAVKTVLEVVYCDDGMPCGGDTLAEYNDAEGVWVEKNKPAVFEQSAESGVAPESVAASERRECAEDVSRFEGLCADFEQAHDLEALRAIVELTPDEAPHHPIREPARIALNRIVDQMNTLSSETNITGEEYKKLKERYIKLSQAVGIINQGIVDHSRRGGDILADIDAETNG